MENLIIEETKYTPAINLNINGELSMKGKSYPENTFEFYAPVVDWIENYFSQGNKKLVFDIEITYFNSSSSKLFFDLFDLLDENNSDELVINWIYDEENESALEAGEDFIEDFENLNINLVCK